MMAALTVEARLGETQSAIEKRFGKPTAKDGKRLIFAGKDGTAVVEFIDGKSAAEWYMMPNGKDGKPSEMSWDTILELMSKQAGGSQWKETVKNGKNRQWVRENRTAVCSYDVDRRMLSFVTREWANKN